MFVLLRIVLAFIVGLCLIILLQRKTRYPFIKGKKIIAMILFIALYFGLCQIPVESLFGFKSVESALRYENWPIPMQSVTTLYANETTLAIYETDKGINYDVCYQKNGRWNLDTLKPSFKWCGLSSVIFCKERKEGQFYLLVYYRKEGNDRVTDNRNSNFRYFESSSGACVFFTAMDSTPTTGYILTVNGISYELQDNGQFVTM